MNLSISIQASRRVRLHRSLCCILLTLILQGASPLLSQITVDRSARVSAGAPLPDAPDETQSSQTNTVSGQQQPANANQQETAEQRRERAQRELDAEERQRLLGIMPMFNMTNQANAAPLSSGQKFSLFFKSSTDPWVFFLAGADAGISQGEGEFSEYGQGVLGYVKRFGASYADTFDGNLWGNAILPSLLHEDPRYFRKGTGSFASRFLYSASTTVVAKRDNGKWGPNYANVLGNLIGGAISNFYYPETDRGVELTFERAWTVTAEGIIGAEIIEFWPDIAHHYVRKHREKMERKANQAVRKQQQAPSQQ